MSPRVWFITGASTGFGRSMTNLVLKKGDIAVATLRRPEVLSDLSSQYSADKLLLLKVDVTNVEDVVTAFEKTKDVFGRIDVVYNNAGYGIVSELEGTSDELARQLFDTNFWGAVTVSREAVKFFREVNKPAGGRLIQMSSMFGQDAGLVAGFYSASKFALEGFSESLAKELDPKWDIKVTLLEPGFFLTNSVNTTLILAPHSAYTSPSSPTAAFRAAMSTPESILSGDTDKASQVVYGLTSLPDPPLRLVLGKGAIELVREKLARVASDVEKYESWSDDLLLQR